MHRSREPERYPRVADSRVGLAGGDAEHERRVRRVRCRQHHYNLNYIPFADHGALLDPPTSDVTARTVTVLALVGRPQDRPALARAIDFLRKEQMPDGSWFGRWGTNYIYGTWSVLMAFGAGRHRSGRSSVRRAVEWLTKHQNADGGWGESNDSYGWQSRPAEINTRATPTRRPGRSWVAGRGRGRIRTRARGVEYLVRPRSSDGLWSDPTFTAPGFPRVFYLKYHGYCAYFPLWALAASRRYRDAAISPSWVR
jgi:squalene-hopene/tetraprenyl-beta-curcumene cyclase